MRAANAPSHRQALCPEKVSKRQGGGNGWQQAATGSRPCRPLPPLPPFAAHLSSVLPYKAENPTELTPLATLGIIVISVLARLSVQCVGAPDPSARPICALGV